MTGNDAEVLIGAAIVAAPMVRWGILHRRKRRAAADQIEDQSFMDFLESMRVAGEEQEADPRTAAIVERYNHVLGRERPRVGAHRAEVVRGRHRALQIA